MTPAIQSNPGEAVPTYDHDQFAIEVGNLFKHGELLGQHVDRLRQQPLLMTDKMKVVLDEIERQWNENFIPISEKVRDTLSDGQLHSISLAGGGSDLILEVWVIPVCIKDAKSYFAQGLHIPKSTYTEIIGRMSKGPGVVMGQKMGGKFLCHIVICADPNGSPLAVQLCLLPFSEAGNQYTRILPMDFLTDVERELWGK